jgi:hypothetical protein
MPSRPRVAEKFSSIRSWDGNQPRAFEELCYQLRDPTPPGSELIKTGSPDAGVEWYWRDREGNETGWQVKFISDTSGLLSAMRKSLKAASEKRPTLTKLTFCIPHDLADDPSGASGQQARQKFDSAKIRWRKFAPKVEVDLLSGGELLERLALDQHRGREWFFFGSRVLDAEWCAKELEGTVEDAGDRYTPQQNVELPIDHILEAVAQPDDLEGQLQDRVDSALRACRELLKKSYASSPWVNDLATLKDAFARIEAEPLIEHEPPRITTAGALTHAKDATRLLNELAETLRPIAWPDRSQEARRAPDTPEEETIAADRERTAAHAQSLWSACRDVQTALSRLTAFLRGPTCQAAELRALFVDGPAGRGKTHLFCDVGERLLASGHPVVVLLGQRFRDTSPWRTLALLLGEPNLSPDEIATTLAASGEASGHRAVLLIDAINEAGHPTMWASELADMRRRLTASGWVGFAVSCRTTYLDLVEPSGGWGNTFARVEHLGYRGREFEATDRIFEAHGVQQPRVPLILPEFSDPLFLKLYCEGLKDDPGSPSGSHHLSAVFERFVAARSTRVVQKLGLDPHLDVVGEAISAFAEMLAESGKDRLAYAQVRPLINGFAPHLQTSPDTLLEAMAAEGLLAIDRGWLPERNGSDEVVSFPYQRFSDHLVLRTFLDQRLPDASELVREAFAADQQLGEWLANAPGGLIEALAIQLPERCEIELPDLLPEPAENDWEGFARWQEAMRGFVSSLVVRDRCAFGPRTHELINMGLNHLPDEMADALISVAPDPEHPYNAAKLHAFLTSMAMAERDAYWTRLLYHAFGDPAHALDRLVRWAARGPYDSYPQEVIELASVPLAWLLASPNRFARDYATKALATLLINRPSICIQLVERFAVVDDPYVKQRLTAAILGAVTRGQDGGLQRTEASKLLDTLLTRFIEDRAALPDILTRDYAASLARWLRRRKLISPTLLRRALPPYGSKPPKRPRSKAYLETAYPRSDNREEGYGSLRFSALSSHSDWSRYVVSSRVDDFLPVKLGDPLPTKETQSEEPSWRINKRGWERFTKSLTPDQLALFELDDRDEARDKLLESLTADQHKLLAKAYSPPKVRQKATWRPMAIPSERAERLIFQRCVELGWTPDKFGQYDWSISRHQPISRDNHKAERFGKKYQWIALYELLARLTDNFAFQDWNEVVAYEGAWQLRVRDIDPTLPPEQIKIGDDQEHVCSPTFPADARPTWWSPSPPTFGTLERGHEGDWAEMQSDLPSPEELLRVTDAEGTRWLIIHGSHHWRDDPNEAASVTVEAGPDRDLAILSRGTILRRASLPRLETWLNRHPDLVRTLPDWHSTDIDEAFWRELPAECTKHHHPARWHHGEYRRSLPVRSAPVSLGYSGSAGGYDCSMATDASVYLPSKILVDLGNAQWSEARNEWSDSHGRPFARYRETGDGFRHDHALIVSERTLTELLDDAGFAIAIGLFCERRVFDKSGPSIPTALGWVDYAGHLIFDGKQWSSSKLAPIKRWATAERGS